MMVGILLTALASSTACVDPVSDQRKSALGPEKPGVRPGPNHRPGQPCSLCHDGNDERAFIVSGTVYATREGDRPVQGARVTLTDGKGVVFVAETNCAGNFFVRAETWQPAFPLMTEVTYGSQKIAMESPIHRESSCAGCHAPVTSTSSPGPVFLWEHDAPADVKGGCP